MGDGLEWDKKRNLMSLWKGLMSLCLIAFVCHVFFLFGCFYWFVCFAFILQGCSPRISLLPSLQTFVSFIDPTALF